MNAKVKWATRFRHPCSCSRDRAGQSGRDILDDGRDIGMPAGSSDPRPADPAGLDTLIDLAEPAANFLKALGHDGRLAILCHLLRGPKSVTELENLVQMRQAVVSQQLARLRLEGLVSTRREGQAIFYSLLDPKVAEMIRLLCSLFGIPAENRDRG